MTLLEELAIGERCKVGQWLADLDNAEEREVTEALASPHQTPAIWRVLTRHYDDLPFREDSLNQHRKTVRGHNGGCKCLRS